MPYSTSYMTIEREVMDLLNILKSDDVATAETAFAKPSPGLVDADIDDAAFPKSAVRRHILTAQQMIIVAIVQTEGHPRRRNYMAVAVVNHLDQLPSGIGPLGAIYDPTSKESYTPRSIDDINRLRANPITIGGVTPVFRYFAYDGTRLFLTTASATVEYCDYGIFASFNQATMDAAFSGTVPIFPPFTPTNPNNNLILLPDEFAPALVFASVAIAAGKAAGFSGQGEYYGQMFQAAMAMQGVNKVPLDFKAEPSGAKP